MSLTVPTSGRPITTTHLTPPHVLDALGGWQAFDLDPCAGPAPRPWRTAQRMNAREDADGLLMRWTGRVWLNPPYSAGEVGRWLARLSAHGTGTALINATTDTQAFQRWVLGEAHGLLFLEGRLTFCDATGAPMRGKDGREQHNPSPSVLCAYGQDDLDRLAASGLEGGFVPLRLARFLVLAGLDQTWASAIGDWLRRQRGPVSLGEAYRYFATHPKAKRNRNWQAKVRQQLQQLGERVAPAMYQPRLI